MVLAELAGVIGSIFTVPNIPTWYANLSKPEWSPPNWLFGPVWISLYALMGIAAWLVWRRRAEASTLARTTLWLYGLQLVANVTWSWLFFGWRRPDWGLAVILVLTVLIAVTMYYFQRVDKRAAWLLAPYLLWVCFASFLNFAIWQLN